ncbi:MAG: hypothetical protein M4D80_05200 [Myxococcota bacterium]|nr:hypothetical protein [Deltaproteobacteria bacterium]MDQ3334535.1 hypothetical protein [Myxococcota bacterium]
MSARTLLVSSVVAIAVLLSTAAPANAEKPNAAFAGKIMLSDKRFPSQAKSLSAFNAKIRSQSKTNFQEDKDKKQWKVHFAGFLRQPLNDLEYIVKVYEMSGGRQQLLLTFEQFTHERGQTALLSNMTLERKHVGVNKELMITMESKGRVLASNRFRILGQGEKYTGKVDFSEEEASGGPKEE